MQCITKAFTLALQSDRSVRSVHFAPTSELEGWASNITEMQRNRRLVRIWAETSQCANHRRNEQVLPEDGWDERFRDAVKARAGSSGPPSISISISILGRFLRMGYTHGAKVRDL